MASKGKGARKKGHDFERKIANLFKDRYELNFRRGLNQARGGGEETADVVIEDEGDSDKIMLFKQFHFELKAQARPNILGAMEQAIKDNKDKVPVVISKQDYKPILVTMKLEDWLNLIDKVLKE